MTITPDTESELRTKLTKDLSASHLSGLTKKLMRVEEDQMPILTTPYRLLSAIMDGKSVFELAEVALFRARLDLALKIWGTLHESIQETPAGGWSPIDTVTCSFSFRRDLLRILCRTEFADNFHPDKIIRQARDTTVGEILSILSPSDSPFPLARYRRDVAERMMLLTEQPDRTTVGNIPTIIPGVALELTFLPNNKVPALSFRINPQTYEPHQPDHSSIPLPVVH